MHTTIENHVASFGHHTVLELLSRIKLLDVGDGRGCNVGKRFLGQEGGVGADQNIRV